MGIKLNTERNKMDYYNIEAFDATGLVKTVFTSKGHGCWLSNSEDGHRGYREVLSHLGLTEKDIVSTFQRHTDIVRPVTHADAGMNTFWRSDPVEPADGIITNERGLLLTSMESDCTPVYLLDPVNKAVGMVHSGWKGTASLIAVKAVEKMRQEYGTDPENVMAAFGPCICRRCYEVGGELMEPFLVNYSQNEVDRLFLPKIDGKYTLDVNLAIRLSLERCGVRPDRIYDCGLCTYHDGRFYSHRRQLHDGEPGADHMLTAIMLI